MNFKETDERMREIECSRDGSIPPGAYIIARLDGRGFSSLTNTHFAKPYDRRFHEMMLETLRCVVQSGVNVALAYTQSDEISLLMLPYTADHGRKARKLLSLLAGAASAKFSLLLGEVATFDCRLNLQYDLAGVKDYFRWRSIDAERNAFNAYCYWQLRHAGMDAQAATEQLRRMDVQARHQMLSNRGIDFNALPGWQKRGVCLTWQEDWRSGLNPVTGEKTRYSRRILKEEEDMETALALLDSLP